MFLFLFLSLDSFLAAAALAMLGLNRTRRQTVCVAFGLCDGLATFAGLHLKLAARFALQADRTLVIVAALGLWALFVTFLVRRIAFQKTAGLLDLYLFASFLSIDNLCASPPSSGLVVDGASASTVAAILSGTLAFAGCQLGSFAAELIPRRLVLSFGCGLLFLIPVLS